MEIQRVYEDAENTDPIREGLYAYNREKTGADFEEISLLCRDGDGDVMGGVLGHRFGRGVFVEILWVREKDRGKGCGSRLLAELEKIARAGGGRVVQLDTFDFQAPDFYRRRGYEPVGQVRDTPMPGHTKYFFQKRLEGEFRSGEGDKPCGKEG